MNISKQRTNSRVSLGIPWKVIVLMLYLLLGWAIFKGWTIRVFYDIRHIALKQVKFVNKLLPNRLKKNARAV